VCERAADLDARERVLTTYNLCCMTNNGYGVHETIRFWYHKYQSLGVTRYCT
jgi:hypothetical protein